MGFFRKATSLLYMKNFCWTSNCCLFDYARCSSPGGPPYRALSKLNVTKNSSLAILDIFSPSRFSYHFSKGKGRNNWHFIAPWAKYEALKFYSTGGNRSERGLSKDLIGKKVARQFLYSSTSY